MSVTATGAVDGFVTAVSAALVALFGLNYYAMWWAFVGACATVYKMPTLPTRWRAIAYVLFSTFIGALLGTAAAEYMELKSRTTIGILSLVGGIGWQGFIALLIKGAELYLSTRIQFIHSKRVHPQAMDAPPGGQT